MSNEVEKEYNLKMKKYTHEAIKKYKGIFYNPYLPPLKFSLPQIFWLNQAMLDPIIRTGK